MKRYETAWEIAKKISVILKDDFGADKVVVFGSLTERDLFTHWSDIDIAAWGIPDKRFYEAVGVVTGLTKEFNIDLIDATDCRFSLHKTIENEGIDI